MDDARIRELTQEVMTQLRQPSAEGVSHLEARVARLEAIVSRLQGPGAPPPAPQVAALAIAHAAPVTHPALRLLDVPGGGERCVLEPDRPCEKSGTCRSFGY